MAINVTGLGIANGIAFKSKVVGGGVVLPPELKRKIVCAVSTYGKTNDDADRDVLVDKTGNGNDFLLSGFSHNLYGGYSEYAVDYNDWYTDVSIPIERTSTKITGYNNNNNNLYIIHLNIADNKNIVPAYKIRVTNLKGTITYYYIDKDKTDVRTAFNMYRDGVYWLPMSRNDLATGTGNNLIVGFVADANGGGATIEQLPEYIGGLRLNRNTNNIIKSKNTVKQMLAGSSKITVVSMVTILGSDLDEPNSNLILNSIITNKDGFAIRNVATLDSIGQTCIVGYTASGLKEGSTINVSTINDILGDKTLYSTSKSYTIKDTDRFYPISFDSEGNAYHKFNAVFYWTLIFNDVVSTVDIQQAIAYFNFDRPGQVLRPDILLDIKRQGITNYNHSEFADKLQDFSGNNWDFQTFNLDWSKASGIGNYPIDFNDFENKVASNIITVNKDNFVITFNDNNKLILLVNIYKTAVPAFRVKVEGISNIDRNLMWRAYQNNSFDKLEITISEDGIYDIPATLQTEKEDYAGWCFTDGTDTSMNVKVTVLPEEGTENSLCLDGVKDYASLLNCLPIYRDYTFASLRKWLVLRDTGSTASKAKISTLGAFIIEAEKEQDNVVTYNFISNYRVNNDKLKEKSYVRQTKFLYNYKYSIPAGGALDTNNMWIGTIRDNDPRFSNVAISNLLVFPYSMSEFLLERQLKHFKLDSQYPTKDYIYWNPKLDVTGNYNSINYYKLGKKINIGDSLNKGDTIQIRISLHNTYKIKTIYWNDTAITPNLDSTNSYYYIAVTVDDTWKQNIRFTVDEYILWNPTVRATGGTYDIKYYIHVSGGTPILIQSGELVDKGSRFMIRVYPNGKHPEIETINFNGTDYPTTKSSDNDQSFYYIITNAVNSSSQTINFIIRDYIYYKDIQMPYPAMLTISDENGIVLENPDDKLEIGSVFIVEKFTNTLAHIADVYDYYYNGEPIETDVQYEVAQDISFTIDFDWLVPEPKFAFDASLFSNNFIRQLGYIPDLTGHGHHLKIFNSDYSKMSGKNGYRLDFSTMSIDATIVNLSDEVLSISKKQETNRWIINFGKPNDSFDIHVSGGITRATLEYSLGGTSNYSMSITLDGWTTVPFKNDIQYDSIYFNATSDYDNIVIRQKVYYEGAFCFDGIKDYAIVDNSYGVRELFMKLNNYKSQTGIIYDQRVGSYNNFAIYNIDTLPNGDICPAYKARNTGDTHIDGVLNKHLLATDLIGRNVNIRTTNYFTFDDTVGTAASPVFAKSALDDAHYSAIALYKAIGFKDTIEIYQADYINNWLSVEIGYIPIPLAYWDAANISNHDIEERDIIPELVDINFGTSRGFDLEVKNVDFEGESGYNYYPVVFAANKTWEQLATYNFEGQVLNDEISITKLLNAKGIIFSYVKQNNELKNIREIPSFKISITGLEGEDKLIYQYLKTEDATGYTMLELGNGTHELPKSFAPTDSVHDNAWVGFMIKHDFSEQPNGYKCNISIYLIATYNNCIALDGVKDYLVNNNIPAINAFSVVAKYKALKENTYPLIYKGSYKPGGGAFVDGYNTEEGNLRSFTCYGKSNNIIDQPSELVYYTKYRYVNKSIEKGTNTDDAGITIGKHGSDYRKMLLYRLFLYDKTINTFALKMLANLVDWDRYGNTVVDLNNYLFEKK